MGGPLLNPLAGKKFTPSPRLCTIGLTALVTVRCIPQPIVIGLCQGPDVEFVISTAVLLALAVHVDVLANCTTRRKYVISRPRICKTIIYKSYINMVYYTQ